MPSEIETLFIFVLDDASKEDEDDDDCTDNEKVAPPVVVHPSVSNKTGFNKNDGGLRL